MRSTLGLGFGNKRNGKSQQEDEIERVSCEMRHQNHSFLQERTEENTSFKTPDGSLLFFTQAIPPVSRVRMYEQVGVVYEYEYVYRSVPVHIWGTALFFKEKRAKYFVLD
jgi:hypothetical protein